MLYVKIGQWAFLYINLNLQSYFKMGLFIVCKSLVKKFIYISFLNDVIANQE